MAAVVQSQPAGRAGHPVRPAQAERDRQPHVRRAGLGERRAVDELDHRVHDRLRVHDDVDAVERDVEEQVRLDQLEALVDQGRRVDRHDRAHVPGRVRQRLLDGDVGELGSRSRPRNGPPLAVSTRRRTSSGVPAAQALGERRVLGVDGHDLVRALAGGLDQRRRRRSATPCWPARGCGPASSAARVGPRPIEPVMPLSTTSQGHRASSVAASGPARIFGTGYSPAAYPPALAAA